MSEARTTKFRKAVLKKKSEKGNSRTCISRKTKNWKSKNRRTEDEILKALNNESSNKAVIRILTITGALTLTLRTMVTLKTILRGQIFCERFFRKFGFQEVRFL